MPEQLIFTSKPTGIQPGRSGFQVVAQHRTLNSRLGAALEKESIYEFADSSKLPPVICKFQKFEFGEQRYSVLTKIQSCGVDFTGRPNHIAHHLVFNEKEHPACPPAAIFALWKGWRQKWDTKPRFLGGWDRVNYENESEPFFFSKFALPAKTWKAQAGDEGVAALPVLSESAHVVFPFPRGKEELLVWLFLESQSLLTNEEAWNITFTNCRIENDNLNRFRWIGTPVKSGGEGISLESETIDLFSEGVKLEVPKHELAEKARKASGMPKPPPQKRAGASAISIAPLDDNGPIQDELELRDDKGAKPKLNIMTPDADELLESGLTSNIPDKYRDEDFEDVFKVDADDEPIQLPDMDLSEEDPIFISEKSLWKRLLLPIILVGLVLTAAVAVVLAPHFVRLFNYTADPDPGSLSQGPTQDELVQKERMAVLEMDPDSRFANQIGEVDSIIKNGQFLFARAYLSRYQADDKKTTTVDYERLDRWFEEQKTLLARVNREIGNLGKDVSAKKVLPSFDAKVKAILSDLENLADDLRPSLQKNVEQLQRDYENWLNTVRLKTKNVPTFFIPISGVDPNPEIMFKAIPEQAKDWLAGLDNFPITSQIEHIRIEVSPFRGLNQFELSAEEALNLSLWKQSERSLISYLDGQTEVLEIISDPNDLSQISFHWRFRGGSTSASSMSFPEPPIILSFLNTLTNQALNVVMMGGISEGVTAPAEVPLSFLRLDRENTRFEIADPVLKEKLQLFVLPPDRFLRLRTLDNLYLFAMDDSTSAFHLYESHDLDPGKVSEIQEQISLQHQLLNRLNRQKTIYDSVNFIKETPLWSLGLEVLPSGDCPAKLETFGRFSSANAESYFEYLREIISYFASQYTMIRPSVMEKWIAYPKDRIPDSLESVQTYRNMLLRTSKRFRSLLKQDDPNGLEYWRNFVASLEFWLLGENERQLVDVLSLSASEISLARETDIDEVRPALIKTQGTIEQLQKELESGNKLAKVGDNNPWLLEMTTLQNDRLATPLILFK